MTPEPRGGRAVRLAVWLPGLAVAVGAAVATAHGLHETALAARVPAGIAWLYPLITDGLALVAYAATARLRGSAARYAWSVVMLAAGLSGLAQAAYLASGATLDTGAVLRFGVGAWPAIAAAIVAHLLYLLATDPPDDAAPLDGQVSNRPAVQQQRPAPADPRPSASAAPPASAAVTAPADRTSPTPAPRERARTAAQRHAHRHGALPTVRDLAAAADVSRGTAAAVLQDLRRHPVPLHLITRTEHDNPEERSQP